MQMNCPWKGGAESGGGKDDDTIASQVHQRASCCHHYLSLLAPPVAFFFLFSSSPHLSAIKTLLSSPSTTHCHFIHTPPLLPPHRHTANMVQSSVLGFPRMGKLRDLKKANEAY